MLADDIVADKDLPRWYRGFDKVQKTITHAQKFVLGQDFALAADGLVENFDELKRIAPFCRIPYQTTWIEFSHNHRTHWRDAPLHYPVLQSTPARIGFLCEATDDRCSRWRTMLCWSLPQAKISSHNASAIAITYDVSEPLGELDEYVTVGTAPFDSGFPPTLPDNLSDELMKIMQSDWAGEIRYLFSVLGLLNARNVAEQSKPDLFKLNRARRRARRLPFFEHTLLKIRPVHRPALLMHASPKAKAGELRAHFVRGHFKTRRTGYFWWGPHMRGRRSHGVISKDYELT